MLQYDEAVTIALGTPSERAARVRAMVATVMQRPCEDSAVNILARRVARLEAEMRNALEVARRAGAVVPITSASLAADAAWVSVQFAVAEAQDRPGLYCSECSGLMTDVLQAVAIYTDDDTRALVHAPKKGCQKEIMEAVA
jgi:hypothetical protein